MENIKKKKRFDITYCSFVALIFLGVTLVQTFNFTLPKWLLTKLPLVESSFVMVQVQAAIAILPLAIIALITGIMKDTLYGVPVIKYVMYLRPVILTYRRVAVAQILLVIISFICMNYGWYNHLELCLLITITNTLIMMLDCFGLLSNYQRYEYEVRSYLVTTPTQEDFKALSSDIIKTKSSISMIVLRDNVSVLNEMLLTTPIQSPLFKGLSSEYINCLNNLFSSKDSDIFLVVVDMLQAAYHEFNENKQESHIFSAIRFEFYNGLRYLNLTDAHKRGFLDELRFELFQNSAYSDNDELYSFTARLYEFGVVNNIYPLNSISDKNRFVAGMYDWFSPFHEFTPSDRRDRLNFFKSLVDNRDKHVLDEKVYNLTDIRPDSDLTDKLFVIQYLYYIAMCEPLADKEQMQFSQEYISSKRDIFQRLVQFCGVSNLSGEDIKLSYALMSSWEITKLNCVKTLVFESVANDFWTFSSLAATASSYSLFDTLGKITPGNEFKLYSQYFADSTTSAHTLQKYNEFCNLFGFSFDEAAIDMLKSFLSEVFKQHSIQEAKREHSALLSNLEFVPEQIRIIKKYCGQLENHFPNKTAGVITRHIQLCDPVEYCFELCRKENERLQDMIRTSILVAVCRIIMPNTSTTEVKFGEPIIPIIEELKKRTNNGSINTAIGSKNCFSYSERKEEQKILDEYGETFLSRRIRDVMLFVSQSNLFLSFENISVNLRDLTREEILAERAPDQNGLYSHTITNNLMGYFTEDEFVEFLQNQQVSLDVECDIKYGFTSDCIGYGVIIKQELE